MLDKETIKRIAKEAEDRYPSKRYIGKLLKDRELDRQQAYIAGAEAEATRAAVLMGFLKNIRKKCYVEEIIDPGQLLYEIMTEVDNALNNYNKTDK